MTDRERLIELLRETFEYTRGVCIDFDEAAEINADHLIANGVVVTPCKVGDTVWMPWEWNGAKGIACLKVTTISNIFGFGWSIGTDFDTDDEGYADKYKCGRFEFEDIGKTVFLTREEAEKALEVKT